MLADAGVDSDLEFCDFAGADVDFEGEGGLAAHEVAVAEVDDVGPGV